MTFDENLKLREMVFNNFMIFDRYTKVPIDPETIHSTTIVWYAVYGQYDFIFNRDIFCKSLTALYPYWDRY